MITTHRRQLSYIPEVSDRTIKRAWTHFLRDHYCPYVRAAIEIETGQNGVPSPGDLKAIWNRLFSTHHMPLKNPQYDWHPSRFHELDKAIRQSLRHGVVKSADDYLIMGHEKVKKAVGKNIFYFGKQKDGMEFQASGALWLSDGNNSGSYFVKIDPYQVRRSFPILSFRNTTEWADEFFKIIRKTFESDDVVNQVVIYRDIRFRVIHNPEKKELIAGRFVTNASRLICYDIPPERGVRNIIEKTLTDPDTYFVGKIGRRTAFDFFEDVQVHP